MVEIILKNCVGFFSFPLLCWGLEEVYVQQSLFLEVQRSDPAADLSVSAQASLTRLCGGLTVLLSNLGRYDGTPLFPLRLEEEEMCSPYWEEDRLVAKCKRSPACLKLVLPLDSHLGNTPARLFKCLFSARRAVSFISYVTGVYKLYRSTWISDLKKHFKR